ncbi:MAG TPA: hypothetical protein VEB63_06825 [Chitinophagaceae bacterium]|nr:hypothetical protein [Chitinophagaceae bacterium]
MDLSYRHLLDPSFAPASRVWVYQSGRRFSIAEALETEGLLENFLRDWKSHGVAVKGAGYLFFGQFLVLMADERATGVSGCSTDSSVRFVKQLEKLFDISFFDRTTLAFVRDHQIELLPISQISYAYENGLIGAGTLFFNNLVQTKQELESNWIITVEDSWLAKKIRALTRP